MVCSFGYVCYGLWIMDDGVRIRELGCSGQCVWRKVCGFLFRVCASRFRTYAWGLQLSMGGYGCIGNGLLCMGRGL